MRHTMLPSAARRAVLIIAVVTAALSPWSISAQSNGPFSLTWSALGGGGGASEGGDFSLMASAGLPDAGQLAGGNFTVSGGFWQCTLIGDFSGNGLIDVADIVAVAGHWQAIGASRFDLDGDGQVTVRDIMLAAGAFGEAC